MKMSSIEIPSIYEMNINFRSDDDLTLSNEISENTINCKMGSKYILIFDYVEKKSKLIGYPINSKKVKKKS